MMAILVSIALLSIFDISFNDEESQQKSCSKHALEKVDSCKTDSSVASWQNSGWWYSDAIGELNHDICNSAKSSASLLRVKLDNNESVMLKKAACSLFGEYDESKHCYAVQFLSSNFNTRYFYVLIIDETCKQSRYFHGSKVILKNGVPLVIDSIDKIDGIPEL